MVGKSDPFYLKFWVNRPSLNEIADFQPIFASSASAITSSEKVQLTLIYEVHYALSNEPTMIIVRGSSPPPPNGGGFENAKRPIFV